MNLDKNQKVLFITDIEYEIERILQEVTNIQAENILTIQSYNSVISHPFGEIMRSVIIAIYEENVKEIFVIGTKDNRTDTKVNLLTQHDTLKDKIQKLEYLFQNCKPEFSNGSVDDWLIGSDNIEKSVEIIRHHPLVPSYVNVRGLIINNYDEKISIVDVPTDKTVSSST